MSEMIERVARAIQDTPSNNSLDQARAAIAAMREPTDAQRNSYFELSGRTEVMMDAHWERAIDAALTNGDTP